MTIAVDFAYARPETMDEALELLAGHEGEVRILAGGTDVVPWLRDDLIAPSLVVDIKRLPGLTDLGLVDGSVHIGALVTFADLEASPQIREILPMLGEAAGAVGSIGIRHRATLVGNICSAVPSCDSAPPLLVHEAMVHVIGSEGARTVAIGEWFAGPKRTALRRGEMVTHVTVPMSPAPSGAAFVRLSRYAGEDLAQASVAVLALPDRKWRVAYGALAPTPLRAPAIEAVLAGRPLDDDTVAAALRLVPGAVTPITDMRASKEYRLAMAGVMLRRALVLADARRNGTGPAYGTPVM
jgi:carbon-monoxide dehydrogenase medium subunit